MRALAINLSLIFITVITLPAFSQITVPEPPISVQSPNAASMALYGEIPVSYFTGVPEISIPLYTLKEKEVTLPLSLNYHASGIRPDTHPGWVGNGWSLSNPGVITRTVHDLPDDDNWTTGGAVPEYNKSYGMGFEWSNSDLNSDWSLGTYMQNVASTKSMQYILDTEPDEFSFNFGNYSGKFYINNLGQLCPTDRRLKIAFTAAANIACPFTPPSGLGSPWITYGFPSSFPGFIITTEDGTQYVFGGTNAAIEYSINFFAQNTDFWLADSWYLTKIIGPDGSQVNFTYTRGPMINQMYIALYKKSYDVTKNHTSFMNISTFLAQTCSSEDATVPAAGPYQGKLISPLYLQEIDSEQGKIKFNISPTTELRFPNQNYLQFLTNGGQSSVQNQDVCFLYGNNGQDYPNGDYPDVLSNLQWEKLDNIQVYSAAANQLLKEYDFTYSNDPTQRLTLLNLQEKDGLNETLPPFNFTYDNSTPLPGYASTQVDYWGFSNGQTEDINTVLSGDLNNFFAFRRIDPNYLMAGTLTKIIYPTGGTTTFQYEPNIYSQELNVPIWNPLVADPNDLTAGGLRIRKITSTDPNLPNQTLTKQYYYYKNYTPQTGFTGRSSGVLASKPQYYWPNYVIHNANNNTTASISVFSWQSVLPLTENTAGTHIAYSEVEEQDQDGGVTQYKFTNFDNGHLDLPYVNNLQANQSPYVPFNSRELERGKLIGKNIYNSAGTLLDSKTYNYTAFGNGTDSIRALKADIIFLCNTNAGTEYSEATAYYHYLYPYLESQMTDVRYDQNGQNPVTTVTNSNYETTHGLLRQKSFTDSKGQTLNTKYLYPFDVVPSPVDQTVLVTKPLSYMVNNNMIGSPLQVVNTKVINGSEQIVSASLTTFKGINITPPSGTPQITIKPSYNYGLEFVQLPLASGLANYAVTYNGNNEQEQIDSRFIQHTQFVNYDQRGNIAQFNANPAISTSPANTSYIWGYNRLFPVVEVKNAAVTDVFYDSFEEGDGNSTSGDAKSGYYSHTGSYSQQLTGLDNGNYQLTYWQETAGVWVLQSSIVTVSNSTYTISLSTQIDDVRFSPVNSLMTTYTYDRLIGLTSSTDAAGKSTYFNYDGFQRLANVEDKNKNIVKNYNYNYAQITYGNSVISQSFTCACSTNYDGTSVVYTVPAGKYTSNNQNSADAQAQLDMTNNGQNYANTNGQCIQTFAFTLTNNTSDGYQIAFIGGTINNTYTFLNNGSITVQVPLGTYFINIYPTGSSNNLHTISLANSTYSNTPRANFTNISVGSGSSLTALIY